MSNYRSWQQALRKRDNRYFNRLLAIFAVMVLISMFLPWTQTVTAKGYLTTLKPDQRPQTIQSPIPGKIEKWYVNEGDLVAKGDTILFISEVKNEYFDPQLVDRTGQQIESKNQSISSYEEKINALNNQIGALSQERKLKLEQADNYLLQTKLKVKSDSIDLEAAKTNFKIAETQLNRTQTLFSEGLKAMTDVEEKRLKMQETQAKLISQENKLLASKNNVINAQVEIGRIRASYSDKISKVQSDQFSARSSKFDTEAQVSKLENDYTNYEIRNSLYYIVAPQSGYITKALRGGVGETFKEGERLVGIMPSNYDVAVEAYVAPIDLPLLDKGDKIRIQFDGWPAVVFSGWPNLSYGTYGGEVVAIENFISENGKYRILITPDPEDEHDWPEQIRVGSGANSLALLDDVPIWFELWRQLNGFPPNYYKDGEKQTETKKNKG